MVNFRPVLPSVKPGYLHSLIGTEVPEEPEHWKSVMEDMHKVILPGITNWQSPNFHAYYPTQTSYPAVIGDMLGNGLGIVGFSWVRISLFICMRVEFRKRQTKV